MLQALRSEDTVSFRCSDVVFFSILQYERYYYYYYYNLIVTDHSDREQSSIRTTKKCIYTVAYLGGALCHAPPWLGREIFF
jgi:hypothetical protein